MTGFRDTAPEESREDLPKIEASLRRDIQRTLQSHLRNAPKNMEWLYAHMHPYFFITMKEEVDAIANLAVGLQDVLTAKRVILAEEEKKLIVACLDLPGSLYETVKTLEEREISYAELSHSYGPLPGDEKELEIQRYEFDRKGHSEILGGREVAIPKGIKRVVSKSLKELYPAFDFRDLDKDLRTLWLNNESYMRISPPERIGRLLWLYQQGIRNGGLYLDIEFAENVMRQAESRLLFSVVNPAPTGLMTQAMAIFQRLGVGVRRSYILNISTGIYRYFLGTFYIVGNECESVERDSDLAQKLRTELYNTQIISPSSETYSEFVVPRIMTGQESSLVNAFIGFCHTALGHNQPDRYDLEVVKGAFHSNAAITLKLIGAFRSRFDPDIEDREEAFKKGLKEAEEAIKSYNTGQRYLDEIRRAVFEACLILIRHTLKTNFFVAEKHAIAFRIDPAYLEELGPEFRSDLPKGIPFRITYFFGRYGLGYHIGFSDIARGGWRTIICRNEDELLTNTNTLFREVFVLAHTQHLKNKDIYEGGSKMTVVLDAMDAQSPQEVNQRLYKVQHGFINAFFDLFVTMDGKAKNPRVVDYYEEDEPIELGPDENMHDEMIEQIARKGIERGYILGIGVMSSKQVGINHKEFGVTSRGVVKFAEIAMKELGVDIHNDPFTVKITGGPNGDVAGNAMRLLLERCPKVKIRSIAAGAGALFDPEFVDANALDKLVLKGDITDFDPEVLHSGGFIIFRKMRKKEGLRELYRKIVRTASGIEERWITADEFHKDFDNLIFSVPADLFLPCGGRPETIDTSNWERLFGEDGAPTAKVIVEGANSYITPEARIEIQKGGVVVLRDASANKCGVISSSYEIIANLVMTEKEFLTHKQEYVNDVLKILDKRAGDEVSLILKRHRENEGKLLYTEIANSISEEINDYYGRLFAFFRERTELTDERLFQKAILAHLPEFIRESQKFRARVKKLPPKIKSAILASEIATSIVYRGGWEVDLEGRVKEYLREQLV